MPAELRRLTLDDTNELTQLWQAANDARRERVGLAALPEAQPVLARPGAFGVGIFDPHLVSVAVALPALADDARSRDNVPGLAHISSVATDPARWGKGLGGRVLQALQLQAIRSGYARAQLWTHTTNVGARRLYEREGFVASGRERPDDRGERIVHFLRDLPALRTRSRPAARLLCVDNADRVLLLHFRDPVDGSYLWEPPGGGIEAGEFPLDAVRREWVEETGFPVPALSRESTYVGRDLVWRGDRWVTDEYFFLGRLNGVGTPISADVADQEMDAYLGCAWIPWQELDGLADPAIPDLPAVLLRLDQGGPWADSSTGTPAHPTAARRD